MNFTKPGIILFLFICISYASIAQDQKDTLKVLFVGNSYIFVSNIPQLASQISDSTNTKLLTSMSTVGGARLSYHWRGERGLQTKEIIKNGDFDIVVLQEQSLGTIEYPDSFFIYANKLCDYIKACGAKPYFYMTWARERIPQQQKIISTAYQKAAKENDAGIVRVGEAWALARQLRPDVELYMFDGSHQSPLGAFLSACMFVGAFTAEVPEKLPPWYSILDSNGERVSLLFENRMDITFCIKVASEFIGK